MNAADRYDSLFRYYGEQRQVDWRLLKAQVRQESGFDPDSRSKVGARGLAQFMARTWDEWREGTPGVQAGPPADLVLLDPRDPEDAIRAQAAYMAWLLDQVHGDARTALAAYNWGLGRVRQAMHEVGPLYLTKAPRETQVYVETVLRYLHEYVSLPTS